jgi:hypothetical protein
MTQHETRRTPYDELRRLARAATPGPWDYETEEDGVTSVDPPIIFGTELGTPIFQMQATGWETVEARDAWGATAAYIAAANPEAVLRTLDDVAEVMQAADRLVDAAQIARERVFTLHGRLDIYPAAEPCPDCAVLDQLRDAIEAFRKAKGARE